MRKITHEELAAADGINHAPAYIAFNGLVYDVSGSYHWRGGTHWIVHKAGRDLSLEIGAAPHVEDLLQRLPVIGRLVD